MARPTKQGVDYFPVDVQFDPKVELLIAETGSSGLGILITVWQLIYQNQGYFIEYANLSLLVRRRVMAPIDEIESWIKVAMMHKVFDKSLFDAYKILTSKGLQSRYFIASKKKKTVSVVQNYLCSGVSVGENCVYIGGKSLKEEEEVKEEVDTKLKANTRQSLQKETIVPSKEALLLTDIFSINVLRRISKKINRTKWAGDFEKLLRKTSADLDNGPAPTFENIKRVLAFVDTHKGSGSFCWGNQIQSPSKLWDNNSQGAKYWCVLWAQMKPLRTELTYGEDLRRKRAAQ